MLDPLLLWLGRSIGGTWLGALLAHCLTAVPWVLGPAVPLVAVLLLWCGFRLLPLALALPVAVQYCAGPWIGRPWPAFAQLLKALNPRAFYRRCELRFDDGAGGAGIAKSKTMLCYHPHGMICCGFSWNGVHAPEAVLAGFQWLVVDVLLSLPLFGLVCGWCNNIKGASRVSMLECMRVGANVALLPGGFEEATICARGADRVWLKQRRGFVKFALRYGYRVHPVYTFGEEETHHCLTFATRARLWICQFKVPAVLFFGWAPCPLIPRPACEICTVVGKAIEFPTIAEPTVEDVALWHKRYVAALVDLFERHKGPCAARGPKDVLEVW